MKKDDRITSAAADSDMQPIVTTSASIEAKPIVSGALPLIVEKYLEWLRDSGRHMGVYKGSNIEEFFNWLNDKNFELVLRQ